ncbi:MAG: chloride channel protein, partial [Azoarcus sp.]|nr:chloride channel protein [Azoarcus sp.]
MPIQPPDIPPGPDAPASDNAHPQRRLRARGGTRHMLPWISPRSWRKRLLLVGAALLAGVISILFAIGADHAIDIHHGLIAAAPWAALFIAPAGFAALAWLTARFFPGTEGSGIPQAIAAS